MLFELTYPKVTILYTGLMGLFYIALSAYVIRQRTTKKVGLGHNQDPNCSLFRAIRIHSNFAEYVPLVLFMMALDEVTGRGPVIMHVFGFSLLLARGAHYVGIKKSDKSSNERFLGAATTFTIVIVLSVLLIIKGLK